MEYTLKLNYRVNAENKTTASSNDDLTIDLVQNEAGLKLTLTPKKPVSNVSFMLERKYEFGKNARFFANGFQSWTDTKEFSRDEKMPGLGLVGKSFVGKMFGLKYVGDYTFVEPEKDSGLFHSFSFAYVTEDNVLDFVGSLNDRNGYTIIYADMNNNTISYSKDLEGITISDSYDLLDLYFAKGEYNQVFNGYFDVLGVKPLTDKKIKGYTSWYNYYQNISESIILRDLEAIKAQKEYVNTYQVDDGYQTAVGDWLSIDKSKFPNGMKSVADAIHGAGLEAGLWLAPFGAQKGSVIAKEHSDWLLKDNKGKPIPVGANWGGFYALDIYNEEARAYIKKVFNEVLNVWGFDLVKLDFLYATSIIPRNNKTRGEIAFDAMDLLRECVGDKKILGCGVQQMPCFGKVEYMRIGPDMSLGWAHTLLRKNMHREDVSTPNAIHNSVYRRCLNGRAFLCDPDVFLLRRTNIKFTVEQQNALAKFIKLFGGVLFMSDNLAEYDENQLAVFKDTLADDDTKIVAINETNDKLFIDYIQNGEAHTLGMSVNDGMIY